MARYNATPEDCVHLSIDIVREIHAEAIKQFGGLKGVRDENLLASAVLTPQSSFGGKSPYADIVEIAAAYLFYVCKNHPFLDGNKRTAMMAAIVFLRLNGMEPLPDSAEWEKLILDVAASKIDRPTTTQRLQKLLKRPRNGATGTRDMAGKAVRAAVERSGS
jgi:death-on-curing protein